MSISSKLDRLHLRARENKWLWFFAIFNRFALAAGFIPSGMVKILGERFTDLSVSHPMGHFLYAFYRTGYYYTFVGVLQIAAAILLLIPRTSTLGAMIYFPIILNICILSFSVRFEGSLLTAPLMVLANLYLLCWNYHKLKFIFPIPYTTVNPEIPAYKNLSNRFPTFFFAGVLATIFIVGFTVMNVYNLVPRNTIISCKNQCKDHNQPIACNSFCDCIHTQNYPLYKCLDDYEKAPKEGN